MMAFTGFAAVLVVWFLWAFQMGFGNPLQLGPGILSAFVGRPAPTPRSFQDRQDGVSG